MLQISGFFLFRIFALWRFNVFGKIRFPSVESKIFLRKRKKFTSKPQNWGKKEKRKKLFPMDDEHFGYKQKFLEKTLPWTALSFLSLTTHKNF
jgi:hypothetical protein